MFNKNKYRLIIFKTIWKYASKVKRFFYFNFLLELVVMALAFLGPIIYKIFIDDVIISRQTSKLPIVILGFISVFVFEKITGYFKLYCTNRLVNKSTFAIKHNILNGYFKRTFASYRRSSIADMKMRIDEDISYISDFFSKQTINYIISVVTMIISTFLLYVIEWRLALFSTIVIPFSFYLDHIISKREKVLQEQQRVNDEEKSSWLFASIQGWREVRALNLQKHEQIQYIKFLHKYALFFGKWINYWVARVLVIPKIKNEFLMKFSLYFIGGLLIMKGVFSIGALLLFIQYYKIVENSVQKVSDTDAELQSNMFKSNRLIEELTTTSNNSTSKIIFNQNIQSHKIEFQNVSFSYGKNNNIINNLNLTIDEGERLAIIGESGCGKTTLLKLLTRIELPTHGLIKFSDTNLNDINEKYLYSRIGYVTQENILFNTSIKDNLLFGKSNATDDEIITACKKACIYEFIKSISHSFDTIIGEKGIKLSGGQRQRIVLARQFLRDVDVLIFDEATSSLDQNTESSIQKAISNIGKNKTVIIVAHRKSSISICNRIINLHKGTIQ